jgi:HSP20 family protein
MVLRRSQGFYPIVQWRNEVNNLISDIFNPAPWASESRSGGSSPSFPALNVWEDGETLFVEAEVPGLKNEDLDISVVGSDLTIRGQSGDRPREGVAYHRQERGFGAFNRVLRMPFDVDADRIEASLTDGVLLLKLPKAESAKPRKIKVSQQ